jgi:hypothetical protein
MFQPQERVLAESREEGAFQECEDEEGGDVGLLV